jgi:hypothetical protein
LRLLLGRQRGGRMQHNVVRRRHLARLERFADAPDPAFAALAPARREAPLRPPAETAPAGQQAPELEGQVALPHGERIALRLTGRCAHGREIQLRAPAHHVVVNRPRHRRRRRRHTLAQSARMRYTL